MSVTGFMYNVNQTKNLGELELKEGYEGHHSWHNQFKDSAYVYIGGLHTGMTEGDVIIMFSQFGEVVDVNLIRDKTTGKSKGFAFICYEDQRSTILAVDNMNSFQMLGRTVAVSHVEKYKAPKKLSETEKDAEGDPLLLDYEATGAEGKGYKVYNALDTQKKISDVNDQRRKPEARKGAQDEDEEWAKSFETSLKYMDDLPKMKKVKKEKKSKKERKKDKEDLVEVMKELKRMKKEAQQAKEEAAREKTANPAKKRLGTSSTKVAKSEKSSSSSSSSSLSEDSSAKPKKSRKR